MNKHDGTKNREYVGDESESSDKGDAESSTEASDASRSARTTRSASEEPQTNDDRKFSADAQAEESEPTTEDEQTAAPDWLIENIAELSKNTRSLYLIYLGALLYCAVTVVGVTDRQMLLDEAVTLPLIGVGVPLTGFFVFAPVVLIATFVYLQLYLQDLQSLKHTMRETYGKEDPGRLYPWIMNVVDHPQPGLVGSLQKSAVKVVLWWLLPVVLFLFGFSYLKMQEPVLGAIITAMPLLGLCASLFFWHAFRPESVGSWINVRGSIDKSATAATGLMVFGVLVFLFVSVAWMGVIPDVARSLTMIDVSYQSLVTEQKYAPYWVDLSGKKLRGANMQATTLINADLSNARLDGANLRSAELDSADFSQASFSGADLRGAYYSGAVFEATDFSNAIFESADFSGVSFRGADFSAAELDSADFSKAHFMEADFSESNLWLAAFSGADLRSAAFSGADLEGASFSKADLRSADFSEADLRSADFSGANLEGAVFSKAKLQRADFADKDLSMADFSEAGLQGADFSDADLWYATLTGADLSGADLSRASLSCTRLRNADITLARVSTLKLCEAATLFELIATSGALREVETQCPARLLESSKDKSLPERCPGFEIDGTN